ncbi:hypothetical protein RvY_12640 [Ramazzottius varieornatus]|uniref:GTPase Era, mitochondrial n=1 Tax=Ramazzottius varieornatus TaxID=947166 RepID=A0A1D1VMG4_RAMVA|nr:hypothetical protein RvY_12640 [Ramazzottius varieornatus]
MSFVGRSARQCWTLLSSQRSHHIMSKSAYPLPSSDIYHSIMPTSIFRCQVLRYSTRSDPRMNLVSDEEGDPDDDIEKAQIPVHPDDSFVAPSFVEEPVEPAFWDRRVPRTLAEFKTIAQRPATQPVNPKLLRMSIVGSPNAGKSTLVNQIIGWRVCSTSSKVHTTRRNTLAITTEGNVQIVLVDTPGVISKEHAVKHHVERSLVVDPEGSFQAVDLVAVLVDASMRYSEHGLDRKILQMLYNNPHQNAILILNKVDLVRKKTKLLEMCRTLTSDSIDFRPFPRFEPVKIHLTKRQKAQLAEEKFFRETDPNFKPALSPEEMFWKDVETYQKMETGLDRQVFIDKKTGWPKFKEVFMISALDGDGTAELKKYLMKNAYSADWRFNPELVSNQSPKEMVLMAVREKLLEHLRTKLPYQMELFLSAWEVDEKGTLRLTVQIKCPRKGAMRHVVGQNGNRVREIAYEAGQEMMNFFRCEVLLKLVVNY